MLMSMGAASSSIAREMSMTASRSALLLVHPKRTRSHWSITSSGHSSAPSTTPPAGSSVCRHVSGSTCKAASVNVVPLCSSKHVKTAAIAAHAKQEGEHLLPRHSSLCSKLGTVGV